jgi:hypothetical protein
MIKYFIWILLFIFIACEMEKPTPTQEIIQAKGDRQAIDLAKKVMNAMGGISNWQQTRYISFNFFGRRQWYWDKHTDQYRVESPSRNFRIAGTLNGEQTHLHLNGVESTDPDSITKYKDLAYKMWVNDTYWLIFPFKLLDPGVSLKYKGDCMADSNTHAQCIELTFGEVGVTPLNKYIAYIDTTTYTVVHWDYFETTTDSIASVSNAWTDYKTYGKIKLSSGRGDRSIESISVHEALPESIFNDVSVHATELLKEKDR